MAIKNKNQKNLKIFDLESNIFTETARGIKLGLTNLWRNRLLSLATIFVMAIMICIFNTILAVNLISKQALSNLNQKVDIVFYLKEGTDYYNST
jgi:cell division protein FtsX